MNKLVSRNPILRFKLGRKIVKAQYGLHVIEDGVVVNDVGVPVYTITGGYTPTTMTLNASYRRDYPSDVQILPGLYLDTETNNVYASRPENEEGDAGYALISRGNKKTTSLFPTLLTKSSNDLDPNRVAKRHDYGKGEVTYHLDKNTGIWYAKWNDPKKPNQGYYRVAEGSTGYNKAGDHNVLRNGKWVKITTPTQKKAVLVDWNKNYDNFKNGLTPALRAYLSKEGVNYDNVESVQNYLLGKLGDNALGKWGADSKWGGASQAAWDKFAALTNFTPKVDPLSSEQLEKDRQTVINLVLSKPVLPTIPKEGISNFTPLSTAKTYNKSDIRDYIRSKGFGAYDFTGSQRKALRMVMNGQGTDEDKAIVKAMGLFKQGGILPSRNIVKRFKNRKFN